MFKTVFMALRNNWLFLTLPALLLSGACNGDLNDYESENGYDSVELGTLEHSLVMIGGTCPSDVDWRDFKFNQYSTIFSRNLVQRAENKLNTKVGGGECTDLMTRIMADACLIPYYDLGPTGFDADYVWGNLKKTVTRSARRADHVEPGNIVQFRDATFKWKTSNGGSVSKSANHHTAIVSAISNDGYKICVLHQNTNGQKWVQYGYYDLSGLSQGWLKFYNPIIEDYSCYQPRRPPMRPHSSLPRRF